MYRAGDVLKVPLTQIAKEIGKTVAAMIVDGAGDAQAARFGERF